MRDALNTMANMLQTDADALSINWAALRFQHTAAVRSRLAEDASAATANKMLSALRGVLKAAWRLGLMAARITHGQRTLKASPALPCRVAAP